MEPSKLFKGDTYLKAGSNLFPSDEISPMKKRKGESAKEFALAFSKALYSGWGNGNFPYSRFVERDKLMRLRNYARGRQSLDTYYDFWYGRNDTNQIIRKGLMNINWDILMVVLKYKDAFISKLNGFEYDPVISSQDQYSRNERQEKMKLDFVKNKFKEILGQADGDENNIAPDSMAEFEILEEMGVYKNQAEYAWEKFIDSVFNGWNKWDKKLKNKLLDDIFSLGRLCVRDYVDPDSQTVKIQYIDPINCIMRLTTDGEVIDGGFVDLMTVQELKKASGLDETTLFSIAQSAVGWYGNPGSANGSGWLYGPTYDSWLANNAGAVARSAVGNCEWYAFRVPVLKCEYRSVDTEYYTEQDLGNEKKYSRGKFGKVFTQSETRKTITKNTINYYTCSWIVGTDYCYDYGLQYDMPRAERAEAKCSFHYYQMEDPSIMERMAPAVDLTLNAWYNLQNNIAKSKPRGYLFDTAALRNANIGDKVKTADIIKGIMTTGSGVYSSINKRADRPVIAPNMAPPVIPLDGGYTDAGNDFAMMWNIMSQMLGELSGMTNSFTGGEQLPEGKAVNQGQVEASNALLQPKLDAYYFIRSSCALNILLRGQVIFRHNETISNEYKQILGEDIVKLLQISSQKNYSQYGMSMTLRINENLKNDIKMAATAATQPGKNGEPGLSFMEYFKILNMLNDNVNLEYIEGFMSRLIAKRQKESQQAQMENADNQNKGLMAIQQQKGITDMNMIKFQTDQDIQKAIIVAAVEAHFAKEQAGIDASHDIAGSALDMIMQTGMQQYLQQMGGSQQAS